MAKSKRRTELETILVLVIALGLAFCYKGNVYFLIASLLLGVTGIFIPAATAIIHQAWMKLSEAIGFVMNRILLFLVFSIIVIPFGWITRRLGKSSIILKRGKHSYYIERNHKWVKEDMENPW